MSAIDSFQYTRPQYWDTLINTLIALICATRYIVTPELGPRGDRWIGMFQDKWNLVVGTLQVQPCPIPHV